MVLTSSESREFKSLKSKSKKYHISIKRIGPANVKFSDGTYAQLGTGSATKIMDARIRLKKTYPKRLTGEELTPGIDY